MGTTTCLVLTNKMIKMKDTILVIDDSESIREIISVGLQNNGYDVIKGINGKEGLHILETHHNIKLILTDLNMPVMDGISFVKEIRKTENYKYIPILLITTESQHQKQEEARKAGATGWIIKPFSNDKLISIIKMIMK